MNENQVEQNNPNTPEIMNEQVQTIQAERFTFNVGDTIIVSTRITEDNRTRIQKFEGIVIAIKGSGNSKNFTVRRIGANEIGVERIFPINSPSIENIEVKRKGMVRRAKLYYLRDRRGKNATFVRAAK